MVIKDLDADKICLFLQKVDQTFPIPLSQKHELNHLAKKFAEKATICVELKDEKICSMVAGYTDNVINNIAYISMVATMPDAQGNGYASKLVKEFIEVAKKKQLNAVHLYSRGVYAIKMYEKLGFKRYIVNNEARPNDVHLIYYL